MNSLFEISIILVLAALLAFLARIFKQPVLIAYLLAGIIINFLWLFIDMLVLWNPSIVLWRICTLLFPK